MDHVAGAADLGPTVCMAQGFIGQVVAWIIHVVPQDASGDLRLCPLASRLCEFCSCVCIVIAAFVHTFYEYNAAVADVSTVENQWSPWFQQLTATLSLAGLIYEVSIMACISLTGVKGSYKEDPLFRNRLRLNVKMMVVFVFLTTLYHCMVADFQQVRKGWIAESWGGNQAVYDLRYIEWVLCAPIVFSISGQLQHAPDGTPRNGIIPSSLLTGIYCLISWQGLVVKSSFAAWLCIGWAFFCYFVASIEQLLFAWFLLDQGRSGPLRAGLLVYLVFMVAPAENNFYCIFDASFKLGTSIVLIATYDLACQEEVRRRAHAMAEDLQRLVDTASVPIFGIDCDGRINQWNREASQIIGVPGAKVVGRPLLEMISDKQHRRVEAMITQALCGEDVGYVDVTMVTPEDGGANTQELSAGHRTSLVLSASSRRDTDGSITGLMLVGCDLTEVEAFKEAEVRKARFMAVVSHELRSPLHGIIGLADRLADDQPDTVKARLLRMMGSCASRLLDLVVNIMEMASLVQRAGDGKLKTLKMQHDPVELPLVIDEIVTLVRNSVDKAGHALLKPGVELRNQLQPMPIIEADAHRCTQVFYNIITNACKFTLKGSVTISSCVDPDGRWVEILVSDTGRGIHKDALDRIFKPFEQEDSSDTRHYDGVGLGLSIAYEVVRLHGGWITVQSEVGVGTTFAVRLPTVMGESLPGSEVTASAVEDAPTPLQQPPEVSTSAAPPPAPQQQQPPPEVSTSAAPPRAPQQQQPPPEVSASAAEPPPAPQQQQPPPEVTPLSRDSPSPPPLRRGSSTRRKPVVLSVDDDPVNQMLIETMLSPSWEVHAVLDGVSALEFIESCGDAPPDCVLLDIMMPGLSGFDVCSAVRGKLGLDAATLPILMLSANPSSLALAEAFKSGCNDYITKPFDKRLLEAHLAVAVPGIAEDAGAEGQGASSSSTEDSAGARDGRPWLRSRPVKYRE
uniref:histidine kinase n=1 Tax=Alexandrium monilatum TaxID=311494 RepID=A0A7S4T8R6_9DINO